MNKKDFTVNINAPAQKVWAALWDLKNYEEWVKPFHQDSTVETDNWKEGTEVRFTDGKGNGMLSAVERNDPNKAMVFVHNGEVKNHEVQPPNEKTKDWAGAREGYYLEERDGGTLLRATIDVNADMASYFEDKFPKALAIVKQIAER